MQKQKITWGQVSYTLYFVGTALIVASWINLVSNRVGWMGFVISMIGWVIPQYLNWRAKKDGRSE